MLRGSNLVSVTVFEIFRVKILTVHLLTLVGLNPRSPDGEMTYYPCRSTILQNFSPIAHTVYEICVTKGFFTFWPRGANPWVKVHQRGEDLVTSKIYHRAKFHRPTSTHARDIRYHVTKVLQTKKTNKKTKKQTVTDNNNNNNVIDAVCRRSLPADAYEQLKRRLCDLLQRNREFRALLLAGNVRPTPIGGMTFGTLTTDDPLDELNVLSSAGKFFDMVRTERRFTLSFLRQYRSC